MTFLDIDKIKKYHEANLLVDALEQKPILFKEYKLHSEGKKNQLLKNSFENYEKCWRNYNRSFLFDWHSNNITKLTTYVELSHNRFLQLRNILVSENQFMDIEILVSYDDIEEISQLNKWHLKHLTKSHMVDFSYLFHVKHRNLTADDLNIIMGQKIRQQIYLAYIEKNN